MLIYVYIVCTVSVLYVVIDEVLQLIEMLRVQSFPAAEKVSLIYYMLFI